MGYCNGGCEFLTSRHNCKKYKKGLAYSKFGSRNLSYDCHERCSECDKDHYIAELEEKQVPKKPEAASSVGQGKGYGYTEYYCPACKSKIVSAVDGDLAGGRKSAFCPDCGQALDWRPSEEFKQLLDTL